jgi:transposase-like protein
MGQAPNGSALDRSGHTTDRKIAPITTVEVITQGERRRAWTPEQKREIVAESLGPGTATEVTRKYGIRTGQLYTWRQQLLAGPNAVRRRPKPGDTRHLDEVFIRINSELHYLWRAVDQHGVVLDILVQIAGMPPRLSAFSSICFTG